MNSNNNQLNMSMNMNMSIYPDMEKTRVSKKRRRLAVTFSTETIVAIREEATEDDRVNSWYSSSELDLMRKDVKIQAKIYRSAISKSGGHASSSMSSLVMPFANSGVENKMRILSYSNSRDNSHSGSSDAATFRGLEPRVFIERQRNRIIATKTTLEYQRRTQELLKIAESEHHPDIQAMKSGFANRLGTICSQLSTWAKDEARVMARYDAIGVYDCEFLAKEKERDTLDDYECQRLKERSININEQHQLQHQQHPSLKRKRTSLTRDASVTSIAESATRSHREEIKA
jgi:hypothetical protein